MLEFAADTLTGKPDRYLWTDAFALLNFLELGVITGKHEHLDLAHRLIDSVHSILGRHRGDDDRTGWISGLSEDEGLDHPTAGGLRIGKKLNERLPGEPYDPGLEWDRDGQYFHYLTKWMHALTVTGRSEGEPRYIRWAAELARAAHEGFVAAGPEGKRMYWKMSIDLSRPLVPSMGQHDPIDGLTVYYEIRRAASEIEKAGTAGSRGAGTAGPVPGLEKQIADLEEICAELSFATDDPLGIGGLLFDAYRLGKIIASAESEWETRLPLLEKLLTDVACGLRDFARRFGKTPLSSRLAFRELGLAISLHAVLSLYELVEMNDRFVPRRRELVPILEEIESCVFLSHEIESTWMEPANRSSPLWLEHKNINSVMLATSLAPGGFLKV